MPGAGIRISCQPDTHQPQSIAKHGFTVSESCLFFKCRGKFTDARPVTTIIEGYRLVSVQETNQTRKKNCSVVASYVMVNP